ncbi:MAG: KpsF/GutQ family sugar-phosphate isomerase [Gammaproteobacteria bacterium]|nr:KpsF/GutQ family sugar-phosphate isomerase [Gammaproteobacteria bacterium]
MSRQDTRNEQQRIQDLARAVLEIEAEAVQALTQRIDAGFVQACHLMLACSGRIIVVGMGKSGHIGGKIAATFASTGSPSFFVHPGEASHGDLGMITGHDVVLAISNSGETDEILTIMPLIKRRNVPLIAMTGNPQSTLARAATVNIDISVAKEACPLGLAPTSSTTATLAMGDALAVSLLDARGFTAEDFALSHPGGRLGRRLLLLIRDIMHTGAQIPKVMAGTTLRDALLEMSRKGLGMTAIVDAGDQLLGVFTDGDLRRVLDRRIDIHDTPISEVMTANCRTISGDMLAAEALQQMEQYKIGALLVVDTERRLVGALNMHDLLRAGVI